MRRALSCMENALFPRAALCLLCGDPRRAGGQDCLCLGRAERAVDKIVLHINHNKNFHFYDLLNN